MFAISLYFMGSSRPAAQTASDPAHSRARPSAMRASPMSCKTRHRVVKSRYDSLGKLSSGSVLVIAEPLPGGKSEAIIRTAAQSRHDPAGPAEMDRRAQPPKIGLAGQGGAAGRAPMPPGCCASWRRVRTCSAATRRPGPTTARHHAHLAGADSAHARRPFAAAYRRQRRHAARRAQRRGRAAIWVLSDPDIIANHGLAHGGQCGVRRAAVQARCARGYGNVVFDETLHRLRHATGEPVPAAVPFPVRAGDRAGR